MTATFVLGQKINKKRFTLKSVADAQMYKSIGRICKSRWLALNVVCTHVDCWYVLRWLNEIDDNYPFVNFMEDWAEMRDMKVMLEGNAAVPLRKVMWRWANEKFCQKESLCYSLTTSWLILRWSVFSPNLDLELNQKDSLRTVATKERKSTHAYMLNPACILFLFV